jgi:hypothetical protein
MNIGLGTFPARLPASLAEAGGTEKDDAIGAIGGREPFRRKGSKLPFHRPAEAPDFDD